LLELLDELFNDTNDITESLVSMGISSLVRDLFSIRGTQSFLGLGSDEGDDFSISRASGSEFS